MNISLTSEDASQMLDISKEAVAYWAKKLGIGEIVRTNYSFSLQDVDTIREARKNKNVRTDRVDQWISPRAEMEAMLSFGLS